MLAARFSLFNLRKETRGPPSLLQLPLFAFCDMIPPSSPLFLRRRHKSGRQNLVSSPFLRSELGSWLLPPWPWRQGQPKKNGITAWETRQVSTLKRTPLIPDLPRLFKETGNESLLQAESSQIGKCPPFCCRSPLILPLLFPCVPLAHKSGTLLLICSGRPPPCGVGLWVRDFCGAQRRGRGRGGTGKGINFCNSSPPSFVSSVSPSPEDVL